MQEQEQSFQSLQMVFDQYLRQEDTPLPRLSTGFSDLDRLLGGGLSPGLIVLGGMPAVGKSTLALQIAAHVAEGGRPVLYFSMEMPAPQLLAKTICCKLCLEAGPDKLPLTAQTLLGLSREQRAAVEDRVKERTFLQNLHVWDKPLPASGILEQVRAFSEKAEKPGLVVVDYLQILSRERGAQSDKQIVDYSVHKLKGLAHGDGGSVDGLPVLLLSSLNRSSYTNAGSYPYKKSRLGRELVGPIQISSFKETGGIEYSADLLLGLEYRACLNGLAEKRAEEQRDPRQMAITVLKNRYGKSGSIPLQYDPAHDCFFPPGGAAGRAAAHDEGEHVPLPAGLTGRELPENSDIRAILNNTKAAHELRKGRGVGKPCSCYVLTDRGTGEKVFTRCALSAPLSSLDFRVADAVYSLDRFRKKISLRAVFQVLLGSKTANLTPEKREELTASIQRLRETQLQLDCREHLERSSADAWDYQGPFLRLDGPDDRGVFHHPQLTDEAGILPLHTYGAAVGQMITVPAVLLDVREAAGRRVSNTSDSICLKCFLTQRLEVIRYLLDDRGGDQKYLESMRTISFAPDRSLLREVRPAEPLSEQAAAQRIARLHKTTELILNYYRRIGYISAAEQRKPNGQGKLTDFYIADESIADPESLPGGSG